MSEEQLKAFLEAVTADAGLQEKLKGASDADAVVAIAKGAGFLISAEELKKAQAEVSDQELAIVAGGGPLNRLDDFYSEAMKKRLQQELSDKELEGVAGGHNMANQARQLQRDFVRGQF
ncbi:Nif11-like leader peptide family natural product precursor [Synechococcus sp. CB0101]|uniref:Nif11-like leader peptide family natural product precursor n=1 Tax=Synechococcus sp. CB0101 TaxID=232348 RepID=UPI0002001367|nr:Nif11-like leader peptide family natural product precursor [Synechococcus sp. CB0101]QCH14532.1 Nif11-like leader peptide family natural product precursor [Synechococcus sp. CB0101]